MQDPFEEVRQQIHEIRNLVGPVHLKMTDLETRIVDAKNLLEGKAAALESKMLSTLFRLDRHDAEIAGILERLARWESRQHP